MIMHQIKRKIKTIQRNSATVNHRQLPTTLEKAGLARRSGKRRLRLKVQGAGAGASECSSGVGGVWWCSERLDGMEAVLPVEVEIPSLWILKEAELEGVEWVEDHCT